MLAHLLGDLTSGERTAFHHAIYRALRAQGHLADGEWQVHGPRSTGRANERARALCLLRERPAHRKG